MFDNLKLKTPVYNYIKKYPYKSDCSNIPTDNGVLSVVESDNLKKDLTNRLLIIFAKAEMNKPEVNICLENIQIVLYVGSRDIAFCRHIAFNRLDGTPLLIEKIESNVALSATALNFSDYNTLLNDLINLYALPYIRYCVHIGMYRNYSIRKLLEINSVNWCNYILPIKKLCNNISIEVDTALCETTIDDLFSSKKLYAIYQKQHYRIIGPINELGVADYVISLQDKDKSDFLVDIRELCDIYEKEYYIESKNRLFKVDLVGKNSVIVEYEQLENYESYGFISLDPRSMWPGWEVDVSLIDAVKYKKKSIYQKILNQPK